MKQESQGAMPMGDSGGGYSLSFVLNIMEDLWTKAIEEYLEVEKKDFKVCICVCVWHLCMYLKKMV